MLDDYEKATKMMAAEIINLKNGKQFKLLDGNVEALKKTNEKLKTAEKENK